MKTTEETTVEAFRNFRIIPVIVIHDSRNALPLGAALADGGLACAEITLRTPAALEALRMITDANPEMLAGAGTVLTDRQARDAVSAGARFIVSPGFSRAVVEYCRSQRIPVFPGAATPTEVMQAIDAGVSVMKFFPAESLGGVATLKAISAPFVSVRFIPTGGISAGNIGNYLALPSVLACGGSWMAPSEWIDERQFGRITETVRKAVEALPPQTELIAQ